MVILNWWWWWPWHWWQYTWWLILVPGCLVTYLVTYALFPNSLEEQAQAHTSWGTRRLIISRGPCWHPTNCPHTQSANISHHIEEFTIFGACLLRFKSVSRVFWLRSDAYCLLLEYPRRLIVSDYLLLVLLVSLKVPNSLSLGFVSLQVLKTSWICHRNLPLCVSSVTRVGLILLWEIFLVFSSSSDRRSGESNCASQHSWVSSSSCDSTSSGGGFELLLFPSVVCWPPRRRHLPILLLEVGGMLGRRLLGWRWCGGGRYLAENIGKVASVMWNDWCDVRVVVMERQLLWGGWGGSEEEQTRCIFPISVRMTSRLQ